MKYIISQADLADLKAKVQSWLSANCRNPYYYYKTKKRITAYLNLCSNFIDKYWQGKKPLLNIGICKNTILLKT